VAIEPLLWFCLDHGTAIHEDRLGLSIERRGGETILLFRTDSKEFRSRFYAADAPQIACDALFFYKNGDHPPLLIFVELKGAHLVHALEQLEATIGAVKPRIEQAIRGTARCLALVVSDGARPTTRANKQREFEARTRVDLRVCSTSRGKKAVELREVLRKVEGLSAVVGE
jgi:hypothetical protein